MKATNPTTQATRRYAVEFTVSMVAYVLILLGSVYLLNHGAHGALMIIVALLPVLPLAAVFAAVVRWILTTDEYQRQTIVTALAIAGGATAMLAVTYGFLENIGFPKMSVWITFVIFSSIWGIATSIVRRYQ